MSERWVHLFYDDGSKIRSEARVSKLLGVPVGIHQGSASHGSYFFMLWILPHIQRPASSTLLYADDVCQASNSESDLEQLV